ncbi:alpha/beta fold hydrolase [Luteococcus peritonei]|uniref:Proline iminopeptidase n=1 Tax=Luteococcus peritonei TaxID=88874 RepID=A0ABW4RSA8_9ACTN
MVPQTSPTRSGMLPVGQGHQLYWEESGNPDGIPALYLHGGPGAPLRSGHRSRFDLERYRLVSPQQRGAGRSTPRVGDPEHRLADNTTAHLLEDLELLRAHLGIDSWLVVGDSWGSTLALHHALAHREAVRGLLLVAVTTTGPQEVDWISEGVSSIYPEAWEQLASTVERLHPDWRRGGGPLVQAVADLMSHGDEEVRTETAIAWMDWEDTHIQVGLPSELLPWDRFGERPLSELVAMTTLVSHYWSHHRALDPAWVPTGGLLAHLSELSGLPLCMVHGRRDVSGPVSIPWAVKQQLPEAQLHVVETEGHGGELMAALARRATDHFASTGDFSGMLGR